MKILHWEQAYLLSNKTMNDVGDQRGQRLSQFKPNARLGDILYLFHMKMNLICMLMNLSPEPRYCWNTLSSESFHSNTRFDVGIRQLDNGLYFLFGAMVTSSFDCYVHIMYKTLSTHTTPLS